MSKLKTDFIDFGRPATREERLHAANGIERVLQRSWRNAVEAVDDEDTAAATTAELVHVRQARALTPVLQRLREES